MTMKVIVLVAVAVLSITPSICGAVEWTAVDVGGNFNRFSRHGWHNVSEGAAFYSFGQRKAIEAAGDLELVVAKAEGSMSFRLLGGTFYDLGPLQDPPMHVKGRTRDSGLSESEPMKIGHYYYLRGDGDKYLAVVHVLDFTVSDQKVVYEHWFWSTWYAANCKLSFRYVFTAGGIDQLNAILADEAQSQSPKKSPALEPATSPHTVSPSGQSGDTQKLPLPTGQRWALIIGISEYRDTRVPSLRYASADARALFEWAVDRRGGAYAPARTRLLEDEQATQTAIKKALYVWLRQALEEDVVTIFFAGHGSPESPDHKDNLFFLPYDVNYEDIATTGFPMWDIETALKRFIKAKKVTVIVDACHGGGVGKEFDILRRGGRGVEVVPITSGLEDLSLIANGICVISASDDTQLSQESNKWGGGHGVFTYFLLQGLRGQADYNKDDRVTLGELIPYLSENVRRATRNAQTPTVAGKFDPALAIGK